MSRTARSATRDFPNHVAVFSDRFLFTTLSDRQVQTHAVTPYKHPKTELPCILFTVDGEVAYTAFSQDFGPLNLAFVFDACSIIHDQYTAAKGQPLCIYTSPDPKTKANMALMVALYCLIVGHVPAYEAFTPIAEMEFRPFRDASLGRMDFGLSIQDCLYGIDEAISVGLLDLEHFDPRSYRYYEVPSNGDLNLLGPFIPFASPTDPLWAATAKAEREPTPENDAALVKIRAQKPRFPNHAFKCVSRVFREQQVGLVVRLNDDLYDRRYFTEAGIDHVDMYFDDGSNPSDDIVRAFIRMAEDVIENRKLRVAVHCKAGLGRTGVLIGAYFIYKYGFSAQEVIGYMRIVRPGMVVGPQQQYMLANQMKWVAWAARDALYRELNMSSSQTSSYPLPSPPLEDEPVYPAFSSKQEGPEVRTYLTPLEELKASTRHRRLSSTDEKMPMSKAGDAVGQPRKGRKPVGLDAIPDEAEINVELAVAHAKQTSHERQAPSAKVDAAGIARGIKRGAGRAPLSSTATSNLSRSTLSVPTSALARSSSTSSVGSTATEIDDREHKRRPTGPSEPSSTSMPRTSPSVSRSPSPRSAEVENESISPARNKPNTATHVSSPLRGQARPLDRSAPSPARNAAELQRPSEIILSPSSIPIPRRLLAKSQKASGAENMDAPVPSTPERAKTKTTSRQADVVRAVKADLKEKKTAPASPRFAVRLLSRLGAA